MKSDDQLSDDPTTVSQISIREGEAEQTIKIDPHDIVIATLGSPNSGSQIGTNLDPPPHPSDSDDFTYGDWSLWFHLAEKSQKFGVPRNFNSHTPQSTLVTFTVTIRDSEFMELYQVLTQDSPGIGALLSFPSSNWLLSISVPRQPICSNQPPNTDVIWGYGLCPEKIGNVVNKVMTECTGKEIMTELLSHLEFPVDSILPKTITIPSLAPLATSPLLPRYPKNRPEVIPPNTTNIGLVGQFTEIPRDTTLNMEYSIRGAQMAVYSLMGVKKPLHKTKRNMFLDVFDLLTEG